MDSSDRFLDWFIHAWSRAALPIAIILLIFSPIIASAAGLLTLLVYLQLPFYMLHQYEEHAHGRFRTFINRSLAGGEDVIIDEDIFWINILGVWGVDMLVVFLTYYVSPATGLLSPYVSLVNAGLHIVPAVAQRQYNPGLWTAVLLFIPLGIYTLVVFSAEPPVNLIAHAAGLGMAILLHAITFAYMRRHVPRPTVNR